MRVYNQHAANMPPFPHQLMPSKPIDWPEICFAQMHAPINANPYLEAIIKGFIIYQPNKEIPNPITCLVAPDDCKLPSLAELNAAMFT